MRRFSLILGFILIGNLGRAQSLPCTAPCDTGDQTFSFSGNTRHYRAYFPANISASVPYTLLVYLGGYEPAAAWNLPHYDQGQLTMLESWANANGVTILYASPLIWDATSGGQPASSANPLTQAVSTSTSTEQIWNVDYFDSYFSGSGTINDSGYLDYLIATATSGNATGHWGAGTVAMVGVSTGGLEAHRFAIDHPSDVVGVGIWAGPLYAETGSSVPVYNAPVNVFIQQGSADPIFNPCGNGSANPATVYYPVLPNFANVASQETTFDFWATGMSCAAAVPNTPICTAGSPTAGFTGKIASSCAGGKQVQFTFVIGGGHDGPTYQGLCNFYNFLFPAIPCVQQPTVGLGASPIQVPVGIPVTFTATVAAGQNGGTPTGMVTFMKKGVNLGTVTLSGGQAALSQTFGGAGTKPISAVYSGDANFAGNTSPVLNEVVVNAFPTTTALFSAKNPSVVGQPNIFTATVSGDGGTPTGTVTFMVGTTTLGTATLSAGQTSLSTTLPVVGTQSITAVYSGDASFAGSTSPVLNEVVVNPIPTTTALVSSINPSLVGQSVILTATVPGGDGTPTGTVTFMKGTTTLGTGTLSGGQTSLSTTLCAAGSQSITAVYSGDANFTGSTSGSLNQVVNQATTTTTLVSSPNPSAAGQSVTLTATVAPQYGCTPTGTVTFTRTGIGVLGTAQLSGGHAVFGKTFNRAGTKGLSAVYSGDTNFNTSTGSLTQTVN